MVTSAELSIPSSLYPHAFLCLLCKELWVLGKRGINKGIVGVTLRSGFSYNSLFLSKGESAPDCFKGAAGHFIGTLSTPAVPWSHFPSSTLLTPLHLSTWSHRGESWSTPAENNLTLSTLLTAMQILLIWVELADLSDMIIAPSCPLTALLKFWAIFTASCSFLRWDP